MKHSLIWTPHGGSNLSKQSWWFYFILASFMQVLSWCVRARVSWHLIQLPWRFCHLFLLALHLPLYPWYHQLPSKAEPFNPVCTFSLDTCYRQVFSCLRSQVVSNSSRRCLPRPSCNWCNGFKSPWKGERNTEIALAVGEGSLARGSARSWGGCSIVEPIGIDQGEEWEFNQASTGSIAAHSSMTLILRVPYGLIITSQLLMLCISSISKPCTRLPQQASFPRHAAAADPPPVQQHQAAGGTVWPRTETSPAPPPWQPSCLSLSSPWLSFMQVCESYSTSVSFCLLFFLFVLHFQTVLALFFGSSCELR